MKYRLLTDEELSHLEEDLKHFLIVNGVHAEEWEAINQNQPEKALALIELFSDTVLEKVYEKIKYLEFQSKENCIVFHIDDKNIHLISIQGKENAKIDLSTTEKIHANLKTNATQLCFFKSSKPVLNRSLEIHQMLKQGCILSSEKFWQSLQSI